MPNREVVLLASAARIATANSIQQANDREAALVLIVDVTARAAATTLTPSLQVQDPIGETWVTVWTAAAAINSSDTTVAYAFYRSVATDAAALYTESVDLLLPTRWRLVMTHSDADSITYSVAGMLIL